MKTRFKPKFSIKKGDSVVVITGDDKDLKKPRKVLKIITEKNRVLVEGACHKKHKARRHKNQRRVKRTSESIICEGCSLCRKSIIRFGSRF